MTLRNSINVKSLNTMWISLPHGGRGAGFDAVELKKHMVNNNMTCIVKGARKCTLAEHRKPKSLDYWLRNDKNIDKKKKNTMQAVKEVIDQLEETGLFRETKCICPETGRLCKGLALTTRSSSSCCGSP